MYSTFGGKRRNGNSKKGRRYCRRPTVSDDRIKLYSTDSIYKPLPSLLQKGSRIICLSSGAAFVPQPGFAVYAASKAYVLSFARALGVEQKGRIVVTAVCPGPVDTPFLEKMGGKENMPFYKKPFIADAEAVVEKALKDSERGREISVYGFSMKALRVVCKFIPRSLLCILCEKEIPKERKK